MIGSGYAVREVASAKRVDPERPEGPALAMPGREADAAECNEALREHAQHVDEQTLVEVRKALIRAGVIYVEKDDAR